MGPPLYGYEKDPRKLKRWIDEEAAPVVRRIYSMTLRELIASMCKSSKSATIVLARLRYRMCCRYQSRMF